MCNVFIVISCSQLLALDLCSGEKCRKKKKRSWREKYKKGNKTKAAAQQQLSAGFTAGIWKGDVI